MPVSTTGILRNSTFHLEKAMCHPLKSTHSSTHPSNAKNHRRLHRMRRNKSLEQMVSKSQSVKQKRRRVNNFKPDSFSANSKDKKRLILNLMCVNDHLFKEKNIDGWKCLKVYLQANKGYHFKLDLKNGYQDIDIFQPHQTYIGLSWVFNRITKYPYFYYSAIWSVYSTFRIY